MISDNLLKLLARIFLAVLFVVTGLGKLVDPTGVSGVLANLHLPVALPLGYLVGICELIGALAVVLGFRVRLVGLLLAAWCVATGLIVHLYMPMDLMKNLGLAGGFLLLATNGAGAFSLRSPAEVVEA